MRANGGDAVSQRAGAGNAKAAGAAAVGDGAGAVHQQRAQRQRFVLQVEHAGVDQCEHAGAQAAGAGERQSAAIDRGAVVAVTAGKRQGVATRLDQIKTHAADGTGERDVARAANAVGSAGHRDGTAIGCRCGAAVDQHTVVANAEAGSGDGLGNALAVEVERRAAADGGGTGAQRTGTAQLERAAGHTGCAGIGVGARKRERTRCGAGVGQRRTGAADGATGRVGRVGRGNGQRAQVAGPSHADLARAAVDGEVGAGIAAGVPTDHHQAILASTTGSA